MQPPKRNSDSEADLPHERTGTDIDVDNGSGSGSGNYDAYKTSWIGAIIQAPPGERGRGTNAHGRFGIFKNEDVLRLAGITHQKWGQYMVSDINIPCRTLLLTRYSLPPTDSSTAASISRRIGQQTPRTTRMEGDRIRSEYCFVLYLLSHTKE